LVGANKARKRREIIINVNNMKMTNEPIRKTVNTPEDEALIDEMVNELVANLNRNVKEEEESGKVSE
jgi:hypothetical protein